MLSNLKKSNYIKLYLVNCSLLFFSFLFFFLEREKKIVRESGVLYLFILLLLRFYWRGVFFFFFFIGIEEELVLTLWHECPIINYMFIGQTHTTMFLNLIRDPNIKLRYCNAHISSNKVKILPFIFNVEAEWFQIKWNYILSWLINKLD